jgi:hypothetical protein
MDKFLERKEVKNTIKKIVDLAVGFFMISGGGNK